MSHETFTQHDKRVTLNLALHSACCQDKTDLMAALKKLPESGWDLQSLPQADVEAIYAEMDPELEAQIKSEYLADPGFLIDLGSTVGTSCPLCGHEHIRFLFNIQNVAGGEDVKCGSSCIITHGLSVKGAETAEHAKQVLMQAITRQKRKLQIEAWHKVSGFYKGQFHDAHEALHKLGQWNSTSDYDTRQKARRLSRTLYKLEKFYGRSGWLGTEAKWKAWHEIASFARHHDDHAADVLPKPKSWEAVNPKANKVEHKLENPEPVTLPDIQKKAVRSEPEMSKKKQTPVVLPAFNQMCLELLTAKLGV